MSMVMDFIKMRERRATIALEHKKIIATIEILTRQDNDLAKNVADLYDDLQWHINFVNDGFVKLSNILAGESDLYHKDS
jgi:hypothetical protein